jgi:hypothetical protein
MAALRFLASVFLLMAAVVLIADVTMARPRTGGGLLTSVGQHWELLAPENKAAAEATANMARVVPPKVAAVPAKAVPAADKAAAVKTKAAPAPKAAAATGAAVAAAPPAPVDAEAENLAQEVTRKSRASSAMRYVWNFAIRPLLVVPTWMLFLSLGLICAYIGRRRRRVNVFIN